MNEEEIRIKVKSWGGRVDIPREVLGWLKITVGDEIAVSIKEEKGERIAVIRKKEEKIE